MEFTEKLKRLRTQYGYSYAKLAKLIGTSASAVSMWEHGNRVPRGDNLLQLARVFSCSPEYFTNPAYDDMTEQSKTVTVPVLGDVSAGLPMFCEENILDYEEISLSVAKQGEYFALRIRGDSMKPRMQSGDVVIVRQQPTVDDGQVAVVLVNGDSATVKVIRHTGDGLSLIPTNPDYSPLVFTADAVKQLPVRILGRVVELRAKYV